MLLARGRVERDPAAFESDLDPRGNVVARHLDGRLPFGDLADVDFGRGQSEHVGRGAHLRDQGKDDRGGSDTGKTDSGDIDEVAAANAVTGFRSAFGLF